MNFDKVIETLRNLWQAHSPTVFTLFVVFLAVNYYVLPKGQLTDLGSAWTSVKVFVDNTMGETGIKVERGYLVAVFLYLALVTLEWVTNLLLALPGLRIWNRFEITNSFTAENAGQLLGSGADLHETERRVRELLEGWRQKLKDRKERSTYAWVADRANLWRRYFGLAVLVAVCLLGWWQSGAAGSAGATSPTKGLHLAILAVAFACVARWRVRRLYRQHQDWETGAALRAYEAEMPRRPDSIIPRHKARGRAFARAIEHRRAVQRHPSYIVGLLAARTRWIHAKVFARLNSPPYWQSPDWQAFVSAEMLRNEEEPIALTALRADAFEGQFSALLECKGSGLFVLAARDLGFAPASYSGGSSYCVAERKHDGTTLMLGLHFYDSGYLVASSRDGRAVCLVDLGAFPIERLAQGDIPALLNGVQFWPKGVIERLAQAQITSGTALPGQVALSFGHSYIWVAEVSDTAEAVIGLQAFAINGRPRCTLIAYRILSVLGSESPPPSVPPWWRPGAWTKVFKAVHADPGAKRLDGA